MDRDRNLLFGIFAVQLRKVSASQLIDVAAAWATDPSRNFATRLQNAGHLSNQEVEFLNRLVDEAVKAHGGDVAATLNTLGGSAIVQDSFQGSIIMTAAGGLDVSVPPTRHQTVKMPSRPSGVLETPGRYSQIGEHARGGMGRVLIVHDEHLGRDIALKELLPQRDPSTDVISPARGSASVVARFLQEARITGQLEHPSIVPVYELGNRADGTLYYTMKLVRGRSLHSAIAEAADLRERLELLPHFVDVCQSIAYAHSRGVIHRDIKPSNIMIGEFGETVVIDWGLAKSREHEDIHARELGEQLRNITTGGVSENIRTAYGQAMGTPAYMPPEQAKGQLEQIDERSDVYSLGAVLYQILTGVVPFEGTTLANTLKKVIADDPLPVNAHAPDAPPELAAICMRAMAKDRSQRYPSVKDLADEMRRFLSGALVSAYNYTVGQRAKRFVRQHRAVLATVTGAVVLLLVSAGYYNYQLIRTNRALTQLNVLEAQQRAQVEHESYIRSLLYAGNLIDDGRYGLAYQILTETQESRRHWEWGYLLQSCQLEGVEVEGVAPVFSQDGRWLAVASRESPGVAVYYGATGEIYRTLSGHKYLVESLAFNPHGAHLASGSRNGDVTLWDVESGETLASWETGDSWVTHVAFRPNGAGVLALSGGVARIWDANTLDQRSRFGGADRWMDSATFDPDGSRVCSVSSRNAVAYLWDPDSGVELHELRGHDAWVHHAAFSPDGRVLATVSHDKTARLWDVETGEALHVLSGHLSAVWDAKFTEDGRRLLTVSDDGRAVIWDVGTGELVSSTSDMTDEFSRIARYRFALADFSPDNTLFSVVADPPAWTPSGQKAAATTLLFSTESMKSEAALMNSPRPANAAVFSPDSAYFAVATLDGKTRIRKTAPRPEDKTFRLDRGAVLKAELNEDSSRVMTVHEQGVIAIWNVVTGEQLLLRDATTAAIRPDGLRVAMSGETTVTVLDVAENSDVRTLETGGARIEQLTYSPDGRSILALSDRYTLIVWDGESGERLYVAPSKSISLSADGSFVATDSEGDRIAVRELRTGREIASATPESPGQGFVALTFSADNRLLYGLQRRQKILVLDISSRTVANLEFPSLNVYTHPRSQRCLVLNEFDQSASVVEFPNGAISVLRGFTPPVSTVSFAPGGKRLFTVSPQGVMSVWDADTGEELLRLRGQNASIRHLVVSPDGLGVLAAAADGSVRVWKAAPWKSDHLRKKTLNDFCVALFGTAR